LTKIVSTANHTLTTNGKILLLSDLRYITPWIVGHNHRFKAAFVKRGVYDLTLSLGEGNAWRGVPNDFGYPWEEGVKEMVRR
jgi:hypothetical protein